MKHECKTLNDFYDKVKGSYEGCNLVNRIEIRRIGASPYPVFKFECPAGFVGNQRERRGKITFEYMKGLPIAEISRTATIIAFLGEVYRRYYGEIEEESSDLSAQLFMDGVESGDTLEIILKQD